ncbi:MAG: PorT family protein [Saprospiraceae bacterium]|nr:PorT family protein [Saprospiraceae bacterium]
MKYSLFSVLFVLFGAVPAFSQLGIKGGIQLATMKQEDENIDQDDLEKHAIIAPVLGVTLDLNITDHFSIQPELLYTQNGGRNTYSYFGVETESTYRINYVEVPVLAKIKVGNPEDGGVGFHVAAGPWLGLAMSGTTHTETTVFGSQIVTEDKFTFDNEDNAKRANFGVIGAAGISFSNFTLDLRYNYGLNNLLDEDADNNNDNKPVLQTRGLAVTLGVTF